MLGLPADIEGITKPISFAVGDQDSLLDKASVDQIIDVMEKKVDLPHEIRIYENQVHGFSIRGDYSDEKDKEAMDEVLKQGTEWLNKYLA
jgi:dienelactone hydrolase